MHDNFRYQKISKIKKTSPTTFFGTVRQFPTENCDIPLMQNFSIPEISEALKGSLTKSFDTVRQKLIDRKFTSPLSHPKIFATLETC